jgi:hypothetical protein
MSAHTPDKPATVVPLAPTSKGQPDANIVADDSGRAIVALLQKAAGMMEKDCARAMDLAHKLSSQLRAAASPVTWASISKLRRRRSVARCGPLGRRSLRSSPSA